MKKTLFGLLIVAIAAPAAFALPAVEYDAECGVSFNPPFGIDGEGMTWVGLLGALDLDEAAGASWNMPLVGPPLDSESMSMEEFFVGDGVPDYFQTSLLAAVICSAEKDMDAAGIAAQFDANKVLYEGFIADIGAFLDAVGNGEDDAMADHMIAAGENLKALALALDPTLTDPAALQLYGLGRALSCEEDPEAKYDVDCTDEEGAGQMFGEFVGGLLDQLLVPTLGGVSNVFTAQVGMSSEGKMTGYLLLYSLLEELDGIDVILATLAGYCDGAAGELQTALADVFTGLGLSASPTMQELEDAAAGFVATYGTPPYDTGNPTQDAQLTALYAGIQQALVAWPVALELVALADEIEATVALMQVLGETVGEDFVVHIPDFEIYGVAATKAVGEPFSGLGDYDGDGLSNADTYANLQGGGMESVGEFVAAASGSNAWYPGSPALPVAGFLGLALLAGGAAVGGAMAIRKK